jgi:hypothetical protein
MKKIAIFVEGRTEQDFAKRLLSEIIGHNRITIESFKASGGAKGSKRTLTLLARSTTDTREFFAQVVDCGTDSRVNSDIRENYQGLVAAGFDAIVGIRDVYPEFTLADVPALRRGLKYGIRTKPIDPVITLGVMEIEAWFIREHTHFARVHADLSESAVQAALGFDPSEQTCEHIANPAEALASVYRTVGLGYSKRTAQVSRIIMALDYASIYFQNGMGIQDLAELIGVIDRWIQGPTDSQMCSN